MGGIFARKSNFYGVFSRFSLPSDSVSFRIFLVEFVATWNHPRGDLFIVACVGFLRKNPTSMWYLTIFFCDSVSIRKLPSASVDSLSNSPPHETAPGAVWNYLMRSGRGFARKFNFYRYLTVSALPPAQVDTLSNSPPRETLHAGWGIIYCGLCGVVRKIKFLEVFIYMCASVSFLQLPYLPCRIRLHAKPPMWRVGNYLLMSGWCFCAKIQFLWVFTHFCASVSFRGFLVEFFST